MRRVTFTPKAIKDYQDLNPKQKERVRLLISQIQEAPFKGIGKPEPLKYGLQGYWSRRIDIVNRLVYSINDEEIEIISCKFHY